MGCDLSSIPEPLPKKPNSSRPVYHFMERNSHKFSQIQAKPASRGSALSVGSPEGGAPEPLERQGLSAARYHSVHGKTQQLFKYYNSVLHSHLKTQPIHVLFSGV